MPTIHVDTKKWKSETFTTNGTWTRPEGVTQVWLFGRGGGGGGNSRQVGPTDSTGGAGSVSQWVLITGLTAASESVTVGTGGAGVNGVTANDGGDTTFGSHATFKGGQGAHDAATPGSGPVRGGGAGGDPGANSYAAAGGAGGGGASGGGGAGDGAGGAGSSTGNGGDGVDGGGGGGGALGFSGGDGGDGRLIVYWLEP